jgi:hypothetical protein
MIGGDPYVMRSGDWEAILAEMDPIAKVNVLISRRDTYTQMLNDIKTMRAEKKRELAAEFRPFEEERERINGGLAEVNKLITGAETRRSRKLSALDLIYKELWKENEECRKQAAEATRIISTTRATHKKSGMKSVKAPGRVIAGGGGFKEKPVDQACDDAIVLGSVDVPAGGKLEAQIKGSPPVPARWSLFNSNSSLAVDFEPALGIGRGRGSRLITLSGQAENSELSGTAAWSGPGRLSAFVGAPRGSGPLTGNCFGQGFSASVNVTELHDTGPAVAGQAVEPGDQIRTDGFGQAVIAVQHGGNISVQPNTAVSVTQSTPDKFRLRLDEAQSNGGVRFWEKPGNHKRLELETGPYLLKPNGTEFLCIADRGTTLIQVIEGSVEVTTGTGSGHVIEAGKQVALPSWEITDIGKPDRPEQWLVNGVPLSGLLADDETSEPYGETVMTVESGRPGGGWLLEDPGQDVTVDAIGTRTLMLTVPDGNDFWSGRSDAPRLLHRVTGDFDLDVEYDLATTATEVASGEFTVMSPGSHIGSLAGQMSGEGLAAHYRLLGAVWLHSRGLRKLPLLNRPIEECPDAPDQPIHVRMTRRGDIWRAYWSLDGKNWNLAARAELPLPETAWAGMLFKRLAHDGLRDVKAVNVLSDVRLRTAPLFDLADPEWDLVQDGGVAIADGTSVSLRLDGARFGAVRAQMGEPLSGDFDLTARYRLGAWDHQPGESRYVSMFLTDGDDKNFAYIGQEKRDNTTRRFSTHLKQDETWKRFTWETTELGEGWMRIARYGSEIRTWYWSECEWVPLSRTYDGVLKGPVYLGFEASTRAEARTTCVLEADFRLDHLGIGETTAGPEWVSADCTLLVPVDVPENISVTIPADVRIHEAPFELGRMFFSPDGEAFLFSSQKDRQKLIRIDRDGRAENFITTAAVAGLNRRSGLVAGDRILLGVDSWWAGGNALGGLYDMARDGSYEVVKLEPGLGGLTDLIRAPDGGLWLSDFENDGIWHLPRGGGPLKRVTTQEAPGGILAMAWHPRRGVIHALNSSNPPGSGQAGVYAVDPESGSVRLIAKPPDGKEWAGMASSIGGAFGDALYVTEPTSGTVFCVSPDGSTTPFIMGLESAGDIGINPATGEMLVVCDGKKLLVVKPGPAASPESTGSRETGQETRDEVTPTPSTNPTATPRIPISSSTMPEPGELLVTKVPPDTMTNSKAGEALEDASPGSPPGQPPATGDAKVYRLGKKSDGYLLSAEYSRNTLVADLRVTWREPGSILDTVGINAAPEGSFSLSMLADGRVQYQIYAPSKRSSARVSNGWHVVQGATKLSRGNPHRITLNVENGTFTLFVDGRRDASISVATRLSGRPVYVGDYPGDQGWGPKFNINQAMLGTVTVLHFGAPAPRQ